MEKRLRGRPKVAPSGTVSAWLRATDHDQLIALAKREDKSISRLVRELVTRRISQQD